ncbi:MAG: HesA/MoeB/ThiF family protein [Marinifilaceae bacterium]
MLTPQEESRYARHLALKEIGQEGQEKIKATSVLLVGAGGLGSPISMYLVAAGIGTLGIIDADTVSESNLQRQILYSTETLGKPKCNEAKQRLSALNPHTKINTYNEWLTQENAEAIISNYDIVIDATDNLPVRYLMDNVCKSKQIPLVHGSIREFTGQISIFNTVGANSYSDLYPYSSAVDTFSQPSGVVGALPGVVGSIQAMETLKFILGYPSLVGKLLLIDLMELNFTTFTIS